MPFLPNVNFTTQSTLDATTTNDIHEDMENYLNGRINRHDIASNTIDGEHIRPPKFYGSPAPRGEFVSSDIHYRQTDMMNKNAHIMWDACSEDWEPVPGLAATMYVHPKTPTDTVSVNVLANWFCRDINDNMQRHTDGAPNLRFAAEYKLFVKKGNGNPQAVPGTRRQLRGAGKFESRLSARNLSICAMVELSQGVNHIYVACRINQTHMKRAWRIYHLNRNIVCDVMYL